eukprot:m.3930 g.3930  ORF g.3930 m.3930 type:complete len:63 (-) comp2147_c0_seq1:1960-2148(-)
MFTFVSYISLEYTYYDINNNNNIILTGARLYPHQSLASSGFDPSLDWHLGCTFAPTMTTHSD